MCGLVGVVGNITPKVGRAFKDLLVFDSVRGPHSTGVAFIYSFVDPRILKKAVVPHQFFELPDWENNNRIVSKCLMGHNRWATTGLINDENAHPFENESIIGMHNGTLLNQDLLDDSECFEVDSENIFHHIHLNGVKDTVSKLHGAYALVWYDKADKTINFLRNKDRPLSFAMTKDMETLFWASERWMLDVALSRHGVKVCGVEELKVGEHVEMVVPGGNYIKDRKLEEACVIDYNKDMYVPPKTFLPANWWSNGYGRYRSLPRGGNQQPKKLGCSLPNSTLSKLSNLFHQTVIFEVVCGLTSNIQNPHIQGKMITLEKGLEDMEVRVHANHKKELWESMLKSVNFFEGVVKGFSTNGDGYVTLDVRTIKECEYGDLKLNKEDEEAQKNMVVGYSGKLLDEKRFNEAVSKGCAWCANPANFEDPLSIKWLGTQEFVCKECSEEEDVLYYINAYS